MVTAGLGSKYVSAYDTSFYWKDLANRIHLIKTNATLNSNFYKIFPWIYFLRRKIKTGIEQTGFCVLFRNLKLSPWRVAISNFIKKWFNSSNQITLGHVKHNKSLYQYHGIIILNNKVYFFAFKIFVVSLFQQAEVTHRKPRWTFFN